MLLLYSNIIQLFPHLFCNPFYVGTRSLKTMFMANLFVSPSDSLLLDGKIIMCGFKLITCLYIIFSLLLVKRNSQINVSLYFVIQYFCHSLTFLFWKKNHITLNQKIHEADASSRRFYSTRMCSIEIKGILTGTERIWITPLIRSTSIKGWNLGSPPHLKVRRRSLLERKEPKLCYWLGCIHTHETC